MKSGNQHLANGMELPNQDKIKTLGEKENYKFLGISEADTIKQVEIKKIKKEYLRGTRKLHETKLCWRNLIKRVNTLAVPLVRYTGPFLKWTIEEAQNNAIRTNHIKAGIDKTQQNSKYRLRGDRD